MKSKIKRASIVISNEQIFMECPFCGKTLIKTDCRKVAKLLDESGVPRGKVCPKCGGVAILRLDSESKKTVLAKLSEPNGGPAKEPQEDKAE